MMMMVLQNQYKYNMYISRYNKDINIDIQKYLDIDKIGKSHTCRYRYRYIGFRCNIYL